MPVVIGQCDGVAWGGIYLHVRPPESKIEIPRHHMLVASEDAGVVAVPRNHKPPVCRILAMILIPLSLGATAMVGAKKVIQRCHGPVGQWMDARRTSPAPALLPCATTNLTAAVLAFIGPKTWYISLGELGVHHVLAGPAFPLPAPEGLLVVVVEGFPSRVLHQTVFDQGNDFHGEAGEYRLLASPEPVAEPERLDLAIVQRLVRIQVGGQYVRRHRDRPGEARSCRTHDGDEGVQEVDRYPLRGTAATCSVALKVLEGEC